MSFEIFPQSEPCVVIPTTIPHDHNAVERAVRGILESAPDAATARRRLTILHGQHLRGRFLGRPVIRFERGIRSASFCLSNAPDDSNPMQIDILVTV